MSIKNNPSSESSMSWDQDKISETLTFEDQTQEEVLESTKEMIHQNYQFSLFTILPGLVSDALSIKRAAKKLGIDEEVYQEFKSRLLRSGLWHQRPDGKIDTDFEFLSLGDITVKDYLAMTVSIIAHLSDARSYEYDTLSLVTNRQHVRQFVSKVNSALRDLHENSLTTRESNDVLFSWTHTGVVELEMKKKTARGADKEDLT